MNLAADNTYWNAYYFITAADYEEYPELTLREKTEKVIAAFRQEIFDFYQKSQIVPPEQYLIDDRYIILWRNLPRTNIPFNTEESLFDACCCHIQKGSPLADFTEKTVGPFLLNIRNTDTLANGSVERFIKRYCLLKKHFYNQPIVFDLDIIPDNRAPFIEAGKFSGEEIPSPKKTPEMDKTEHEKLLLDWSTIIDPLEEEKDRQLEQWLEITHEERKKADELIAFLEKLYIAVTDDSIEHEENNFIYYYFQWQMGKISVEAACRELNNMSKRTFYNYVSEFEAHPFFPEYEKIYFYPLFEKPKKGPLSIDLEQFYADIMEIYPNSDFQLSKTYGFYLSSRKSDYSAEYRLCDKYNIPTVLDLCRTFMTVCRKLKIKL